ncbi:MAG: hypothetical protein PHW76_09495 [Alphaproteobacteria bacterium]|nr:hypothetical protein [Alphaproteobacteria bacterium]
MTKFSLLCAVLGLGAALVGSDASYAREAAFLSPNMAGFGAGGEAVKVEPKADIDVGETLLNVAKRATVFFVNQTSGPIKIEKITLGGDSSVSADLVANDCEKQGSIPASSRCSVEVSITPIGPGPWSVELLMTHGGAGRMTRARLLGRAGNGSSAEAKSMGLSISAKEIKPIDFGTVDVGFGKVVRSALMINDSPETIIVNAIDVIAAENGLEKLDQGCAVDMELQPGSSCPVTLLWDPKDNSPISTDLIIRHSGKMGFTVIPVRGIAKGGAAADGTKNAMPRGSIPLPMSATDLEREVQNKITPVSEAALSENRSGGGAAARPFMLQQKMQADDGGVLTLIGTVGTRAVFLLSNGQTAVVKAGEDFDTPEGAVRLVTVYASAADVRMGSKQMTLPLKAASSLVAQAVEQQTRQDSSSQKQRQQHNGGSNEGGRK